MIMCIRVMSIFVCVCILMCVCVCVRILRVSFENCRSHLKKKRKLNSPLILVHFSKIRRRKKHRAPSAQKIRPHYNPATLSTQQKKSATRTRAQNQFSKIYIASLQAMTKLFFCCPLIEALFSDQTQRARARAQQQCFVSRKQQAHCVRFPPYSSFHPPGIQSDRARREIKISYAESQSGRSSGA